MRILFQIFFYFFLFVLLSACERKQVKKPEEIDFYKISASKVEKIIANMDISAQGLRSWNDLATPLRASLAYANARPQNAFALKTKSLQLTWKEIAHSLKTLLFILPFLDRHPELLADYFVWYEPRSCLFTGYFEPTLRVSSQKSSEFPYPLYGLPKDLQSVDLGRFHPRWQGQSLTYRLQNGKIMPYWDRKAIDRQGKLQNQNLELAWAADEIDVFFLQIQGSGRLLYPDGSSCHIVYAGKNGHEYIALGRIMLERGLLQPGEVNMSSIRYVLETYSELRKELLDSNPSYVFFALQDDGPFGSMGKKLTPWVSLASDPAVFPWSSLLAFSVELPNNSGVLQGIGLPQDTGGAIKNLHLDLFCGAGEKAEAVAGFLQKMGQVWLLVSKQD